MTKGGLVLKFNGLTTHLILHCVHNDKGGALGANLLMPICVRASKSPEGQARGPAPTTVLHYALIRPWWLHKVPRAPDAGPFKGYFFGPLAPLDCSQPGRSELATILAV